MPNDNSPQQVQFYEKPTFLWIVGSVFLYFVIRSELQASSARNAEGKVVDDVNYNLAQQLHTSFSISVWSEWVSIATADINAVYSIAEKIKDFTAVQNAYYDLYSETLISRLEKVFSDDAKGLQVFYSKFRTATSGTTNTAGKLVLGRIATVVRTTNALDYANSSTLLKQFNAGSDAGKYIGDVQVKVGSVITIYAVVEISWYLVTTKKALIKKIDLITY